MIFPSPLLWLTIIFWQALTVSSKICVATAENRYLCTDDASKARAYKSYDEFHKEIDFGVEQRVDGTDVEKKGVEEVMQLMEDYFNTEVLVKPEYAPVRDKCKNTKELCAFWASVGECEANRGFMVQNCSASCRLCLLLHATVD